MTEKGKGFESPPAGKLLQQIVILDTEMGIAYERSIGFHKDFHSHDRDLLVFPREACRMEVNTKAPENTYQITSSDLLYIPQGVVHDDRGLSTVYDTVALLPSQLFMQQLIAENGLEEDDHQSLRSHCYKRRRSRWIDDLIERYFFERVLNANSPKGCAFFLEKQILNELARLIFTDKLDTIGAEVGEDENDILARALRYIEGHLFQEISNAKLAAAIKCGESTLLRAFKKALGTTPGTFIRDRRLDEAALLIRRGDYQVGDVCMLVGYEDISSFSRSFKDKFGLSPSQYKKI